MRKMKVKFLDLKEVNKPYENEIRNGMNRVIDSGWYLLGKEVESFEKEYSNYVGVKHTVGVANGLDALRIILRAYIEMGIMKGGDEIIVPANTYIASILAITDNNLTPVLVEPDISTYNMYMTSFIQYLIDSGWEVRAAFIDNGWVEVYY